MVNDDLITSCRKSITAPPHRAAYSSIAIAVNVPNSGVAAAIVGHDESSAGRDVGRHSPRHMAFIKRVYIKLVARGDAPIETSIGKIDNGAAADIHEGNKRPGLIREGTVSVKTQHGDIPRRQRGRRVGPFRPQ